MVYGEEWFIGRHTVTGQSQFPDWDNPNAVILIAETGKLEDLELGCCCCFLHLLSSFCILLSRIHSSATCKSVVPHSLPSHNLLTMSKSLAILSAFAAAATTANAHIGEPSEGPESLFF